MDDLISRQAAINAFVKRTHLDWENLKIIHPMFRVLEEVPAAQERKTGKWINDKGLYRCTACKDFLTVAGWASSIPEKVIYTNFEYCPHCGVKMEL